MSILSFLGLPRKIVQSFLVTQVAGYEGQQGNRKNKHDQ